jgi:hypothetical protein
MTHRQILEIQESVVGELSRATWTEDNLQASSDILTMADPAS